MRTFFSFGDVIDLYYKIHQKGYLKIATGFNLSGNSRTALKWNHVTGSSDFWIIPEVRRRWNQMCTNDPSLEYEDFFVEKYLPKSKNLSLLSVGCGSGARERKLARYKQFKSIEGIDLAEKLIDQARKEAAIQNFDHIHYISADFWNHDFKNKSFDVILFNSSLHHFNHISFFLQNKVLPLLKPDGYLVIFEYTGPNRLQWKPLQMKRVNEVLQEIPEKYRKRTVHYSVKKRVYRPGWFRMMLVDPSEAVDSESILPALHKYCKTVEEKKVGWNITHLLFKDIAHNFLNDDPETQKWIFHIFRKEDEYLVETGDSDAIFGIYQKREMTR